MIQFYCLVLKTKWPKSRPHIWIQPCLHCWFNLNIFHYSYLIVTYLKLFLSFIKNYDYHCWMSSLAVSFLGTFPQMLESCFCVSLQSTLSPSLFFFHWESILIYLFLNIRHSRGSTLESCTSSGFLLKPQTLLFNFVQSGFLLISCVEVQASLLQHHHHFLCFT